MKKIFFSIALSIFAMFIFNSKAQALLSFPQAVATCEKYSLQGGAEYNNEYFNILITLEKGRGNSCIYKEKIFQNKNYQLLTCEFHQAELTVTTVKMV